MEHQFDGLHELLSYLDTAPYADAWYREDKSSQEESNGEWHGTENFQQAYDLCKYGQFDNGFEKLHKLKIDIDRHIKEVQRPRRQFNDMVGYAPDVPSHLNGYPLDMFNHTTKLRKQVDIFFNCSQNSGTSSGQILNKGATLLSTISILEDMGIRTNLNFFELSKEKEGYQVFNAQINIKREDQPLDMRNAYFPICNPAFLRRIIFNLQEKTPDKYESWTEGYGQAGEKELVNEIIEPAENAIVFNTAQEMGVKGDSLIDDANSIFEFINRNSGVKNLGIHFDEIGKQ